MSLIIALSESAAEISMMVFSAITTVLGVVLLLASWRKSRDPWEPEDAERGLLVPVPGDNLLNEGEPAVSARFRAAVIGTLVEAGHTRDEAEEAVTEGTWTTNFRATRYCQPNPADTFPTGTVLEKQRTATLEALQEVRARNG